MNIGNFTQNGDGYTGHLRSVGLTLAEVTISPVTAKQGNGPDFAVLGKYALRHDAFELRTVANDDNAQWLKPAFAQMHRLLKAAAFCVSFYGWNKADLFIDAWRNAGSRIVGHVVFRKRYPSSTRFLRYQHEQAYVLAKGDVQPPAKPIPDVIEFPYTGNKLHPTQKPTAALRPLIEAFCPSPGIVLDPFAGSGSSLVAARQLGRQFIGIELDEQHHRTATTRLHEVQTLAA